MRRHCAPARPADPVRGTLGKAAVTGLDSGEFDAQLAAWRTRVERALAARLPDPASAPTRLHAAIRYCVLGPGPRAGTALLFATAGALGLAEDRVEAAACAVELMHAYAQVHDELMADGATDRRAQPACHTAYDAATAILVGDSLPPLAFRLLAEDRGLDATPPDGRLRLIQLLSEACDASAMAGSAPGTGGARPDVTPPRALNAGALGRASVLMAAACEAAVPNGPYAALRRFAGAIEVGLAPRSDAERASNADRRAAAFAALLPLDERADPLRATAAWLLREDSEFA